MPTPCEVRVEIGSDMDIVAARQKGRALAVELSFTPTDVVRIATAISELARNVLTYARRGEIRLRAVRTRRTRGIVIVARDSGPGIANLELALQDGYSTSGGLGLGLPGVRRLVDGFRVDSTVGRGTTVTATKWCGR
jgi:serine/threonine-protein kinase RsbT